VSEGKHHLGLTRSAPLHDGNRRAIGPEIVHGLQYLRVAECPGNAFVLQIKLTRVDTGGTVERQHQFNDHGCFLRQSRRCQRQQGKQTARPDAAREMTHSSLNLRQSPPHA
jgi:hypothetical protein